jgi:hypothetical protein
VLVNQRLAPRSQPRRQRLLTKTLRVLAKNGLAAALARDRAASCHAAFQMPLDLDPASGIELLVHIGRQLLGDETTLTHRDTGTCASVFA